MHLTNVNSWWLKCILYLKPNYLKVLFTQHLTVNFQRSDTLKFIANQSRDLKFHVWLIVVNTGIQH